MRPVELWLFHAASPTDPSRVPAAGATVTVYFQGASVTAETYCYDWGYSVVPVGARGRLRDSDVLQIGTDTTRFLVVGPDLPDFQTVNVATQSDPLIVLVAGDRLLVDTRFPTLYADSAGQFPIAGNSVTVDAKGYARFYCAEANVDYIATGGGLPGPLLFTDIEAGWTAETRPTVNVLDYPTFQAAHDALPLEGGTIFVPAGQYSSTSSPCAFRGLVVTKPMTLVGEADGFGNSMSQLRHDMFGAQDVDALFISCRGGCAIRSLYILGPATAGSGRGLRWYVPGVPVALNGLTLDSVILERTSNLSFEFVCDGHTQNSISGLEMIGCTAFNAQSGGGLLLSGGRSRDIRIERCEFNGPGFGSFRNVTDCAVTSGSTQVLAPVAGAAGSGQPTMGDVVSGFGIAVGTTVANVVEFQNTLKITLSRPAIDTPSGTGTTTLAFYRAADSTGSLRRGHVHLEGTTGTRLYQCNFQGPADTPALSTDLGTNSLLLRDTYREKSTSAQFQTFLFNGTTNLLADGLFHQFHDEPSLLLKTGPAGLVMGRFGNAQLTAGSATPSNLDIVSLGSGYNELRIENSYDYGAGPARPLTGFGSAPVLTVPSSGTLAVPDTRDKAFFVSGAETITAITPLRANRRVRLIFIGTASVARSSGIKLSTDSFGGTPNSVLGLVCDGTKWFEVGRSAN